MTHHEQTTTHKADALAFDAPRSSPVGDPRVLLVTSSRDERRRIAARLAGTSPQCAKADSLSAARMMLDAEQFDVVVVRDQLSDGRGLTLAEEMAISQPGTSFVLLADEPDLDQAVHAMRAGVTDIVGSDSPTVELIAGVCRATSRARAAQASARKAERLQRMCHKLNDARQEVTKQVRSLCNDLSVAYDEMADHMARFSLASEFSAVIRAELDVEGLLRAALEYTLAKVGPTNAAVFLPTSSHDFSLGAYVNYDCPRETADILLDHLTNVVAPRMEGDPRLLSLTPGDEMDEIFGDEAQWLCDSNTVMFSCQHEGECLAVVILFRDQSTPFTDDHVRILDTICEQFAQQLGRVVHIHHRHLPRDQWGTFDGPEDDFDDFGLAA
jgi:DNA-binding response OmpR family regulator